jgi:hypothetical protein
MQIMFAAPFLLAAGFLFTALSLIPRARRIGIPIPTGIVSAGPAFLPALLTEGLLVHWFSSAGTWQRWHPWLALAAVGGVGGGLIAGFLAWILTQVLPRLLCEQRYSSPHGAAICCHGHYRNDGKPFWLASRKLAHRSRPGNPAERNWGLFYRQAMGGFSATYHLPAVGNSVPHARRGIGGEPRMTVVSLPRDVMSVEGQAATPHYTGSRCAVKCRRKGASCVSRMPPILSRFFQTSRITSTK